MFASLSEITAALESNGIAILASKEVQNVVELKVPGAIITSFTNGNVQVEGEKKKQLEDLLNEYLQSGSCGMCSSFGQAPIQDAAEAKVSGDSGMKVAQKIFPVHQAAPQTVQAAQPKEVFIVHGLDRNTLLELTNLLCRNNYIPIVPAKQRDDGTTIFEKLERELQNHSISAGIILATPDDMSAHPYPTQQQYTHLAHCRPNFELELGFFIGRLGREKIVYLRKSVSETVEFILPSEALGIAFHDFSVLSTLENKILSELAHITRN